MHRGVDRTVFATNPYLTILKLILWVLEEEVVEGLVLLVGCCLSWGKQKLKTKLNVFTQIVYSPC